MKKSRYGHKQLIFLKKKIRLLKNLVNQMTNKKLIKRIKKILRIKTQNKLINHLNKFKNSKNKNLKQINKN